MTLKIIDPARLQLRMHDSETGSYPTATRVGDVRTGIIPQKFDDSLTVVFSSSIINYPGGLPSSSLFLAGQTSSLDTMGVIIKGIGDRFVSFKPFVQDMPPFDDSRYLEQNRDATDDPFHLTGSRIEDVGDGFTSGLKSKTRVVIDLNPSTEYAASINNGDVSVTNPLPAPAGNWDFTSMNNYPMAYFNFSKKSWEGIGLGIHTSITGTAGYNWGNNTTGSCDANLKYGMYGFAPSYAITASVEGTQAATPFSNFGFPSHPKFHATSSQQFHMSGVISHPFLVEKIIYEFSGSYKMQSLAGDPDRTPIFLTSHLVSGPNIPDVSSPDFVDQSLSQGSTNGILDGNGSTGAWGAPISTFFILNQRRPFAGSQTAFMLPVRPRVGTFGNTGPQPFNPATNLESHVTTLIPSATQLSQNGPVVVVDTIRDIVTFTQVSALGADYTERNIASLSRELNIKDRVAADEYWGGSFVMSGVVKSPVVNPQTMTMFFGTNDQGQVGLVYNEPGGRSGFQTASGRDLATSVVGYVLSRSVDIVDEDPFTVVVGEESSKVNPYIVYPTDTLVFGWQVPMGKRMHAEGRAGSANGIASELHLKPGKGKLILYGSLIREGAEFHDTLNQPLTSPAVHEDVHEDDTILDQYMTEPRQLMSGTYISRYVSGAMDLTNHPRQVVVTTAVSFSLGAAQSFSASQDSAQLFAETAKVPGFLRAVQLVSTNERFLDTTMPTIGDIVVADGSYVYAHFFGGVSHGFSQIILGTPLPFTTPDDTWNRAYPYEPRYSSIPRSLNPVSHTVATRDTSNNVLKKPVSQPLVLVRSIADDQSLSPGYPALYLVGDGNPSVGSTNISERELLIHIYGIGSFNSGTVRWTEREENNPLFDNDQMSGAIFTGFKYGIINALPQFSKMIVRSDSYGQLRDVLEQRLDSAFYDVIGLNSDGSENGHPGESSSPIRIVFVEPNTSTITRPERTWSSNLSTAATSSLPFFDSFARNREDPIEASNLNTVTVTL